nr:hypothetical protein GCM10020063_012500 [Dactylosporangium thailandense]
MTSARERDRLRRQLFGEAAGRSDPHASQRVFLFTHETLRMQAIDRLGPRTVAAFAERLHAWAAGYQQQHWPPGTPAYLLRGQPIRGEALARSITDPSQQVRPWPGWCGPPPTPASTTGPAGWAPTSNRSPTPSPTRTCSRRP